MNQDQWDAHFKFIDEVVKPAAIKAALARPMTEAERKSMEEYVRIFNDPDTAAARK